MNDGKNDVDSMADVCPSDNMTFWKYDRKTCRLSGRRIGKFQIRRNYTNCIRLVPLAMES